MFDLALFGLVGWVHEARGTHEPEGLAPNHGWAGEAGPGRRIRRDRRIGGWGVSVRYGWLTCRLAGFGHRRSGYPWPRRLADATPPSSRDDGCTKFIYMQQQLRQEPGSEVVDG